MAKRRPAKVDSRLLRSLNRNVLRLARRLEAGSVAELVSLNRRPFRLMWVNLLAGLTRGIGFFLGAGVMGAVVLALVTALTYYALAFFDMIPWVSDLVQGIRELISDFVGRHRSAS